MKSSPVAEIKAFRVLMIIIILMENDSRLFGPSSFIRSNSKSKKVKCFLSCGYDFELKDIFLFG
nr:MAG: hypothetical protein AM325_16885 [Candidatus Thorarchaeota archaeon SMTZ1-45]